MRRAVLTDLDGTLLDAHTYDWSPAVPALDALRQAGIPLIICTSKTRAEVEALRAAMGHGDPFIVENGGAIYIPEGYFAEAEAQRRKGATAQVAYQVVELGVPYSTLVTRLREASHAADVTVRGWADMPLEEIARRCEMSAAAAALAVAREYDEPFVITGEHVGGAARLQAEIEARGARLTRGDRFFHVMGAHDKGDAARAMISLLRREWGALTTVAVGDAANDIAMLAATDHAIVVASPQAATVAARVPGARLTRVSGPAGWNEAILEWLSVS